ncbi:hypothetical protein FRD01_16615 [Microvenator marinus]|uniref:Type II secretion system protein GspE N-terminal domain-containing protein n=1 Tax=Microvenator marinus TaxID=2600177 RepID=A0A5B8XS96_9DELT|nr:hypothetical protein [Microvenator marinus]QED28832.1 hypothetical protein FRD01_16615 [Microvenator marinus]
MIDDSELAQGILEAGLVDRDVLMEVAHHRSSERNLYYTLLDRQVVEERDLVRLAGKILNVPTVRLERISIEPEVLDMVPASMANRNRVIPLSIEKEGGEKRLVLGMIDPIDVLAMDEVSTHTGIDIRPVLVGPTELEAALIKVYTRRRSADAEIPIPEMPVAEINAVDPNDPFSDIGELALEAIDNAGWEEFFDSAAEVSVEDSAVISQDMRDRPASGVFEVGEDDEDGIPSIDMIEMVPATSQGKEDPLDEWEVDDAITNTPTNKVDAVTQRRAGKSQIVSAADAMNLFADPPAEDDEDVGEPTERKSFDELSESNVLEKTGKTTVGIGVAHLDESAAGRAALRAPKAKTAHTDRLKRDEGKKRSDTDYGELGRQILKSEIEKDAEKETDVREGEGEDPKTERKSDDKKTDLKSIAIPDDADLRLVLQGLVNTLLEKEVVDSKTIRDILALAKSPRR